MDLESLIKKTEELIGLKCKIEKTERDFLGHISKVCTFATSSGYVVESIVLKSIDGYSWYVDEFVKRNCFTEQYWLLKSFARQTCLDVQKENENNHEP